MRFDVKRIAQLLGVPIIAAVVAGCAGAAPAPTPVPTKAAAPTPSQPSSPAPKAEATKPAAAAPTSAPSALAAQPTKVRIALMKGTQIFPAMVMEEQGFDKKHGIVLEKKMGASPDAINVLLRSKEVDVALNGWVEAVKFRAQGVKIINTFPLSSFVNAVVVKKDSPLKGFEDVKGRNFGSFYNPSTVTSGILRVSSALYYGFDPYKETKVQQGAKPLLIGLLDKGEVEAIYLGEPDIAAMLATGKYRPIATIKEIYNTKAPGVAIPLQLVTQFQEEFTDKNPAAAKGFAAALQDAVAYLKSNSAVWTKLAKEVEMEDPKAVDLLRQSVSDAYYGRAWDKKLLDETVQFGKELRRVVGPDILPDTDYGESFTMKYLP